MIPSRLLQKLADDPRIPESSRLAFLRTLDMDRVWRSKRSEKRVHEEQVKASARILVHDCEGQEILPGVAVDPMMSADATVQRAFRFTKKIAQFYLECLNRNSIDDAGKDLVSSVHFSQVYSNAYWSPSLMQMVYGDGDGFILLDFTLSPEFIAHEVAHGLTHFTADLDYVDQAGALNESVSDVLGTMFVQWLFDQSCERAHWKIGPDIVGPTAKQLGWVCVRDLASPSASHSMTVQPQDYESYIPDGDPHDNSGIPNRAFYLASSEVGGRSWERTGRVWYEALLDRRCHPSLSFSEFAALTIEHAVMLFPGEPRVALAVARAWTKVKVRF